MEKWVTYKNQTNPDVIHPYSPYDPLPVPEVYESNTDAAWALWQDSLSAYDNIWASDFAKTRPADL